MLHAPISLLETLTQDLIGGVFWEYFNLPIESGNTADDSPEEELQTTASVL